VLSGMGKVCRLDLVPVRFMDAQSTVGCHHIRVDPARPRLVDCFPGGDGVDMAQLLRVRCPAQQGDQ
jgi:hypothetical protein